MIVINDAPKTKQGFADLVKANGYKVGAEIGVREGDLAEPILATADVELYYLVDPWCNQPPGWCYEPVNFPQGHHDAKYRITMERLEPYQDRMVAWRMYSHEAVRGLEDGTLDWVYLDGNHLFPWIFLDLHLWVPKVKAGGMVAGHDFFKSENYGVMEAVDEFFPDNQVIHASEFESMEMPPIWWTIKMT